MRDTLRLDKWLWQARFFKSRALAGRAVEAGGIRLNGRPAIKAHAGVAVGDRLTLALGKRVVVVDVVDLGSRRGPATEARMLYRDLAATTGPERKG